MNYGKLNKNEQMALFYLLNPLPNEEYSKMKKKPTNKKRGSLCKTERLSHLKSSSLSLANTYRDLGHERSKSKRELSLNASKQMKPNLSEKYTPDPKICDLSTNVNDMGYYTNYHGLQEPNEVSDFANVKKEVTVSFVSDLAEGESLFKHLETKSQVSKTPLKLKSEPIHEEGNEQYLKIFSPSKKLNISADPIYNKFLNSLNKLSESKKKAFERVFVRKEKPVKTNPEEPVSDFDLKEKEIMEKVMILKDEISSKDKEITSLKDNQLLIRNLKESIEIKGDLWEQYLYKNKLKYKIFEILRKIYSLSYSHLNLCYFEIQKMETIIQSTKDLVANKKYSSTQSKSLNKLVSIVKGDFMKKAKLLIAENWDLINMESDQRAVAKELAEEKKIAEALEEKREKTQSIDFRLSDRFLLKSQSEILEEETEDLISEVKKRKTELPAIHEEEGFNELELNMQLDQVKSELQSLQSKNSLFETGIQELRQSHKSKSQELTDLKESLFKFGKMKQKQVEEIGKLKFSMKRRETTDLD